MALEGLDKTEHVEVGVAGLFQEEKVWVLSQKLAIFLQNLAPLRITNHGVKWEVCNLTGYGAMDIGRWTRFHVM